MLKKTIELCEYSNIYALFKKSIFIILISNSVLSSSYAMDPRSIDEQKIKIPSQNSDSKTTVELNDDEDSFNSYDDPIDFGSDSENGSTYSSETDPLDLSFENDLSYEDQDLSNLDRVGISNQASNIEHYQIPNDESLISAHQAKSGNKIVDATDNGQNLDLNFEQLKTVQHQDQQPESLHLNKSVQVDSDDVFFSSKPKSATEADRLLAEPKKGLQNIDQDLLSSYQDTIETQIEQNLDSSTDNVSISSIMGQNISGQNIGYGNKNLMQNMAFGINFTSINYNNQNILLMNLSTAGYLNFWGVSANIFGGFSRAKDLTEGKNCSKIFGGALKAQYPVFLSSVYIPSSTLTPFIKLSFLKSYSNVPSDLRSILLVGAKYKYLINTAKFAILPNISVGIEQDLTKLEYPAVVIKPGVYINQNNISIGLFCLLEFREQLRRSATVNVKLIF